MDGEQLDRSISIARGVCGRGDRYSLLDRVIEQVTGKSFAANLEELIITPLELKTTATKTEDLAVPLAKPYSYFWVIPTIEGFPATQPGSKR